MRYEYALTFATLTNELPKIYGLWTMFSKLN